jgi:hypothetical protein
MGLLEQVDHLRERIHALQSLKKRAEKATDFEQRAETLAGIVEGFDTLCTPAQVLVEADIEISPIDQVILRTLRAKVEHLSDSYARDRSSILSPFPEQDFRQVFVVPCNTFNQKTEKALRESWSHWVRARMPVIDQEVLNVLAGVDALTTSVASIQALLKSIERHTSVLPESADVVKEVLASCAQAKQAWQDLAGDGVGLDILEFLRAGGSETGAPYDSLKPSVLAWLDEHNLRHVLRIRLG